MDVKTASELEKQIKRFQSFKERTGTDKTSSFSVHLSFNCWDDKVYVEFGGYNVGNWSRHESIESTWDTLVEDITKKVDEADEITKYERWCPSCEEYTDHDPKTGKCLGYWGWGDDVAECNEVIEL